MSTLSIVCGDLDLAMRHVRQLVGCSTARVRVGTHFSGRFGKFATLSLVYLSLNRSGRLSGPLLA